jgi:enoyl-CoA hydratase/carnithine racemase
MALVEYEKKGHIATIRLNRPERLNAMNYDMFLALAQSFVRSEQDEDVWVSILTGRGRAFTVGLDLKEFLTSGSTNVTLPDLPVMDPFFPGDTFEKPVIAAVNGIAVGGGFWLTLHADLRVSAESASFQIGEVSRGLSSGIYPVKQCIAREKLSYAIQAELLSGAKISAQRAYEVGFVNKVTRDEDLMKTATEMAEHLISVVPPLASYYNLKLLRRLRRAQLIPSDIEALGKKYYDSCYETEDMKEASQAFFEKRKPVFRRC